MASLLDFCACDNAAGASSLLQPLLDAIADGGPGVNAKKDELLELLFVDRFEQDDTPVEAAIRVGPNRDPEANTAIRLYMLDCLYRCGPSDRLKNVEEHPAHVLRLGKTLERQVVIYMARLGALLRPYASAKGEDASLRDFYLDKLCDFNHSEIGLFVANAFYAEYGEMRQVLAEFGGKNGQRMARYKLARTFPNDKDRGNLGTALFTTLQLAMDADTLADAHEHSLKLYEAERLRELSQRLQNSAAAAVDTLGDDITYLMLRHARGQEALRLAVLEGMTHFLSKGALRGAVRRLWLGEKLFALLDCPTSSQALEYVLWVGLNILTLPLVGATPWVEAARAADRGWGKVFGLRENYLMQVASFQAFSFQLLDLMLTLYLTFLPTCTQP